MKKMTQNRMVKPENTRLTLRGDINRIQKFVAKSIATEVVKKIQGEDNRKGQRDHPNDDATRSAATK